MWTVENPWLDAAVGLLLLAACLIAIVLAFSWWAV